MTLDWKIGGVLLGGVFFLAVLLVKPIGVSTQFVILDAKSSWHNIIFHFPRQALENHNAK